MLKRSFFILIIILSVILVGCPDKVNYAKGESIVEAYLQGQIEGNKEKVNSVINMKDEPLEYKKKYALKNAEITKMQIEELQSNKKRKIITASYVIKDGDRQLNGISILVLKKKNEKWLVNEVKEQIYEEQM